MAINTSLTSVAGEYTNISPAIINIEFSEDVISLSRDDVTVTNGSVIQLSGSGSNYSATVSPNKQDVITTVKVNANVAKNALDEFNLESNVVQFSFVSVSPRVIIRHEIPNITLNQLVVCDVEFERSVTGFDAADVFTENARVESLTGGDANYKLTIVPLSVGDFSFRIKPNAAVDMFGNNSAESNTVYSFFDQVDVSKRSKLINGSSFGIDGSSFNVDDSILYGFTDQDLQTVVDIQGLADCAKNVPQRLLEKSITTLFQKVAEAQSGEELAKKVENLSLRLNQIQAIVNIIQPIAENPETLASEILEARGLSGDALSGKVNTMLKKYANVSGISKILSNITTLDICKLPNVTEFGERVSVDARSPTYLIPPAVHGVTTPLISNYDSTAKDEYDAFMFQLKEFLEIDNTEEQTPERAKMIAVINTLAFGYHDDIAKTTSNAKDAELNDKYIRNVENERQKNIGWSGDVLKQFDERTKIIGDTISRNTDIIRSFINRNAVVSGTKISTGITTYSGPDRDFTTFLDIKKEQRPPELTAYWSRRYNIEAQEQRLRARGIIPQTLNYSDAYNGSYGPLISDQTVASSRFPGDSIIQLKRSDGTIYDPTGRNPSGQYKVTDTGNSTLTFNKVDVFTSQPEKYLGKDGVDVYLISLGTRKGKRFLQAQAKFGRGF